MRVHDADRSTDGTLLSEGIYEPQETTLIETLLEPGHTIFDIGANIGYFALLASRIAGEDGLVCAFEPEPRNYDVLCHNIELNGARNVRASRLALADQQGRSPLHISESNLGRHSLYQVNVPRQCDQIDVEVYTVDELAAEGLLPPPDFIKIDVEGAELRVLHGGRQVIEDALPTLWIEIWPQGLAESPYSLETSLEWLCSIGYYPALYDDLGIFPMSAGALIHGWKSVLAERVSYLLLDTRPERIQRAARSVAAVNPIQH
jgi:FkbM family methyltransferase